MEIQCSVYFKYSKDIGEKRFKIKAVSRFKGKTPTTISPVLHQYRQGRKMVSKFQYYSAISWQLGISGTSPEKPNPVKTIVDTQSFIAGHGVVLPVAISMTLHITYQLENPAPPHAPLRAHAVNIGVLPGNSAEVEFANM